MNAGVTLNVKSIEIYLDATATLTSEGLAEGALQVQDFRVKRTFYLVFPFATMMILPDKPPREHRRGHQRPRPPGLDPGDPGGPRG